MKWRFEKNTVVIEESRGGWRLRWNAADEEYQPTAADALAAVKEMARILADGGINSMVTIEWKPRSRVGWRVVRALQ